MGKSEDIDFLVSSGYSILLFFGFNLKKNVSQPLYLVNIHIEFQPTPDLVGLNAALIVFQSLSCIVALHCEFRSF